VTELEDGVRVVTERIPTVRSVALGFWIGTGSTTERDAEAGLSHLLEHMLFRGSDRYGSSEIDQIFDAMGAELNAGTGKETTSVYVRVLADHLERAFDVIADMVWRPAFEELEAEREVVLEEIAMYEDDPQDRVFDLLGEAVFGEHPLGRAILGRADVVRAAERGQLQGFHDARYLPGNVVIAAAGAVDHGQLVDWTTSSRQQDRAGEPPPLPAAPAPRAAELRFLRKDTEQYHVCLGGHGVARSDERRFALRVLDSLLGGTSSSRLFQEIRERRGLAYSVYTFQSLYSEAGQVGLYVGTRPENLGDALQVIAVELEKIAAGAISDEELDRARENVKGRVALALESTTARMDRLGSSLLAEMPILSLDETIERIDAVSVADVAALASVVFDPSRMSAAGIGPDREPLARALETVNPALAADE
jgi:predicted Zn-dependent peptidase